MTWYSLKPKYHVKDVYNNVESSNVKEGNKQYSGNIVLWHNRFCHMNIDYLVLTSKVLAVNGLPKFKNEKLDYESCKLAKTKRVSFKPIGRIRSTRPLQLVHMDMCCPLPVVSCGRAKYSLSITDDFSRMMTCFPLNEKSQVFEYFKSFQANAERVLNHKILSVRCDNGMEFCHSKFSKDLNELGMRCERINTCTPEQNCI
ncbi:retrovirus-related Pol polyprotein from transposon TNT 1-94 [Trichonephila clavipes]|uniref:Retrovirus-related Pol polyprotein from transposon TNT 1-94 n=1 Tax=Trichonephila clavipes TaxID=2585209 RepID=A0A8X6RXV3_TRICX|nr:retrovirus-related Pol polyprotein from transposon TNT 1-94 [Trichonephila clavipes]